MRGRAEENAWPDARERPEKDRAVLPIQEELAIHSVDGGR